MKKSLNPIHSIAIPLAAIPEFVAFAHDPLLKTKLLAEHPDEAGFVAAAAPLIERFVLATIPYRAHGSPGDKTLSRLLKKGHTTGQIAHALAQAWYREAETFELPPIAWRERLGRTRVRLTVACILALVIVAAGMQMIRHTHPQLLEIALAFPPFIAIAVVLVGLGLFYGLRRL